AACHLMSLNGSWAGGVSRNGPESVLDCGASIVKAAHSVKLHRYPTLASPPPTGHFCRLMIRALDSADRHCGAIMGLLRRIRAAACGLALLSTPAAAAELQASA